MLKSKGMLKRIISMVLSICMMVSILQVPVLAADGEVFYVPQDEISEEILTSGEFYLASATAEIQENSPAAYLFKVGRGGSALPEAEVRLNMMDITAKYGDDYSIKIHDAAIFGNKVKNANSGSSMLDVLLDNPDEIVEENYTDSIVSEEMLDPDTIEELYQEDVAVLDEFLTEEVEGYAEEKQAYMEAVTTANTLEEAKELATGLKSDKVPMDGGENSIANYTEEMLSLLSLELESAYLIVDFQEGETEKYIEIIPKNNDVGDGNRMFSINLFAASEHAVVGDKSALMVHIIDDEEQEAASVTFKESHYYPENGYIKVTMQRDGAINQLVSVNVKTEDDTALKDRDYSQVDTVVAFPYGITERTLNIPIRSDYVEGSGEFKLIMSDAVNCEIGGIDTAYGVIMDNSVSYRMRSTASDGSADADNTSRADANSSSYFTGEKFDIENTYSSWVSSKAKGSSYVKPMDEGLEVYTCSSSFDVYSELHWDMGERYDVSGLAINWTKKSGKPCYTETFVYGNAGGWDEKLWDSSDERWDQRTTKVYFPYAKGTDYFIKQVRDGGWLGKSPTLQIHSIEPILRPFEITLKGAEPLKFLNENGEYVDNTTMSKVADANNAILRNATNTGTGTVVKFSGDTFTVASASQFSYIKGVKIVHEETGASKILKDNLPKGTTSVSFDLTNDFLKENLDYIVFSENGELGKKGGFFVQPILGQYDTVLTLHDDYRGEVSYSGAPEVEESADGKLLRYHRGDYIRLTQTVHPEYASSYTGTRIRIITQEDSTARKEDDLSLYEEGTNYYTLHNVFSHIEVYPNFDKKDNHIVVRVAKADVEKFKPDIGVFALPGAPVGNYMEYTVVESDVFAAGEYYEFSAKTKEDGYTPVWQKINDTKKYSQGTFYFEGKGEIEQNIVYLSCQKADALPYSLTGDAYYSDVALNGGEESPAWMAASGVRVLIGSDAYGVSDANGVFNTLGMNGIDGMYVICKIVASGQTEYKTVVLSDDKISQFGSSGVELEAYDVGIGTILAAVSNREAPYVNSVSATRDNGVESGVVYIDDKSTFITVAINNNECSYRDTDGVLRTEKVIAVDFLVYDRYTHQLKEVVTGAREMSNANGISVWMLNTNFQKGEQSRYAASDKLYVRLTTDKVVGNGMGYDADGALVELEALKQTEYAPLNTGYTFVESNRTAPVTQEAIIPTDIDFIPLPFIGQMEATFNVKYLSFKLSNLPNGGHRLSLGVIIKGSKFANAESTPDNGGQYEKGDFLKAAADVKTMGKELKAAGLSRIGMSYWGVAPIVGAYLDFGIKNAYYDDNITQKFVFIGGGIYLGVTGKFRLVQYFVIGTLPCYVGVDGEITGYLEYGLTAVNEDTATSDRLLSVSNSLNADYKKDNLVLGANSSVQVYAGAGICGLIGVRGGIAFYPNYIYQPFIKELYPTYHDHGGMLTLQLKFWIDAFLFPIPIPAVTFVEERFGYFKDIDESDKGELTWSRRSAAPSEDENDTTLNMKPRTEASKWLPTSGRPTLRSTFAPDTSTVLLENGYDSADSKLLDMGDGRILLAFIADDPTRSDKDRTALMYSIYDDGVWSAPVIVQNDGTADFEPHLCNAGDKVLISWMSRAEGSTYASELEFLKTLEIYTTTLDKTTLTIGDIERLTDDEFYDSAPVGIYDDVSGDYVVYYLKSEVGSDFATSVSPTTNESVIVYMLYDAKEGKWARDYYYDNEVESEEAEDFLVEYWGGQRFLASPIEDFGMNDPIIVDFGAISYNGLGVYTFTVDEDNNMDTESDRELFVQVYDFEGHATYVPIRITNDNIADARPQLVRNADCTYLFWLRNNEEVRYVNVSDLVKHGVNDDGTIKQEGYEMEIGCVSYMPSDSNVNPTFGSYTAFVDKDNNLYIAWLQPVRNEDGSSSQEIYASAFLQDDSERASWSEGVRLTNSDAVHDEVAFVTDTNGDLLVVSNQYTMDLSSDEYAVDNVKLVATKYKTVGSLEVQEVSYSNDTPKAGATISVNTKIKNTGLKNATGYTINVYEKTNGAIGTKIYTTTVDAEIAPSFATYATFDWTMPDSYENVDDLALYIEVQEAEMSEIENYTSPSIQIKPVYEIVDYAVEQRADGFYANYTIRNIGNADATSQSDKVVISFNDIYCTGAEDKNFLEAPIGELEINESKTFDMPLEIDEPYFEFGYTNAFIEVQDKDGAALSGYDAFMIMLEHPYDISLNGDAAMSEIKLTEGDRLPMQVDYAGKAFYGNARIGYEIEDLSVVSVKEDVLVANQVGETEMKVMLTPFGGEKTVKVVVEKKQQISSGGGGGITRYTVKLDTNGGNQLTSLKVNRNSVIGEIETPVKDGFVFDGWYTDKDLTKKANLDAKITSNMTLYAKWIETTDDEDDKDEKEWKNPFVDVKADDWFYESVKYANQNGLFGGTAEDKFSPNDGLTRAMLVTVLYRAEGEPKIDKTSAFKDVSKNSYYEDAVSWAQANGIVSGMTENEFAPDLKITREQIATIMYRYAVYKGIESATLEENLAFEDTEDISGYAVSAMNWIVGQEIIKGYDDNTVKPKNNATRAEATAVVQRFLEKLNAIEEIENQ